MNIENLEAEYFTRLINNQANMFTTPIAAEDFEHPAFRAAMAEAKRQIKSGITPDVTTIAVALPAYAPELMKINSIESANFEFYERQMIEAVERRRYTRAAAKLVQLASSTDPFYDIHHEAMTMVSDCRIGSSGVLSTTAYDLAYKFGPILEKRYALKNKLAGVTTGFPKLDSVLGGYQPGIYYIGARPSQGKTAMLLTMMLSAMRSGHKVAMISIESSEQAIIERMLSADGPIPMTHLKTGAVDKGDMKNFKEAMDRFKQFGAFINFNPKGEISEVERTATTFVKGGGAEIIYIDYLQRITAPGRTKIEEVSNASRMVTDLSRVLGVPVVCLAQTGRQADSEAPQMSHFQHSSQIEQDADVAMVINHKKEDDGREESFLTVLKNRDGEVGQIPIFFDRNHVRFKQRAER